MADWLSLLLFGLSDSRLTRMYESFLEVDLVARVICHQSHRHITSYGTIRSSGDCLDWKYRRSTALGAIIIDRMDVTWLNCNANANANVNGSSRLESETTSTPSVRLRLRLRYLLIRYGPKSLMALLTVVTNDVDVVVDRRRYQTSRTVVDLIRNLHNSHNTPWPAMPMAMPICLWLWICLWICGHLTYRPTLISSPFLLAMFEPEK